MAKAIAICKCEKCGAEFKKTAFRNNRRDAEEWEEWAEKTFTICPDCEEEEYQARIAEQKKADAAEGLPELTGSEKQITWAVDIRGELLEDINHEMIRLQRVLEDQKETGKEDLWAKNMATYKQFEITVEYIRNTTSCRWWIDHRDENANWILRHTVSEAVEAAKLAEPEESEEKAENDVIVPENATEGTVTITVTEDTVEARYVKDDTFRGIVKDAGYKWDGHCWYKQITEFTGSAVDRAADLANRLLTMGFSIRCENAAVREKAVDGSFEPECTNWIRVYTSGDYEGWLSISVPGPGKDKQGLYDAAHKIKGSRYNRGFVAVPMARYAEVADFAGLYGYKFSSKAIEEVNAYLAKTRVKAADRAQERAEESGEGEMRYEDR